MGKEQQNTWQKLYNDITEFNNFLSNSFSWIGKTSTRINKKFYVTTLSLRYREMVPLEFFIYTSEVLAVPTKQLNKPLLSKF